MMEWQGPGGTYLVAFHADVYRPSHDTFLLARAVADEVRPGDRFLEVGCGAGLVAMVAARLGAKAFATDLNPRAVELTLENARANRVAVDAATTDLLDGVQGPLDVVAFNPPYLPTGPEEVLLGPLNLAFDGGLDGNGTVLRFAAQLAALVPLPRTVLVVHSSLADPTALASALAALGYAQDIVGEESHFFERLQVRRFRVGSAPFGTASVENAPVGKAPVRKAPAGTAPGEKGPLGTVGPVPPGTVPVGS